MSRWTWVASTIIFKILQWFSFKNTNISANWCFASIFSCYTFNSVLFAEWPPLENSCQLGKPVVLIVLCLLVNLVIFRFRFQERDLTYDCASFLFIAFLLPLTIHHTAYIKWEPGRFCQRDIENKVLSFITQTCLCNILRVFIAVKNDNFQIKKCDIILIFALIKIFGGSNEYPQFMF